MKKTAKTLRALLLASLVGTAAAAAYDHAACNCWEGDYICTYEDANHNIVGYGWYSQHPGCL
jgi:hypothetical protein